MKKKLISSVITIFAITICVGTSLASAKTVSAGGGTWSYGTTGLFGGGTVYSKYLHNSEVHGSSVINANGVMDTDYNRRAGVQSNASTAAVAFKTDHSYYCKGWR